MKYTSIVHWKNIKIYPNWEVSFENIPSGNLDIDMHALLNISIAVTTKIPSLLCAAYNVQYDQIMHNFALRVSKQFHNFQALLNHEVNVCSCFYTRFQLRHVSVGMYIFCRCNISRKLFERVLPLFSVDKYQGRKLLIP
jgi:hypothetical protein